MLHRSETWPVIVRKENEVAIQCAEIRVVRWMCGIKLKDRVSNKEMKERLEIDDISRYCCKTGYDGVGMYCERKTMTGCRIVWSMIWRAPDQEVDQRGFR